MKKLKSKLSTYTAIEMTSAQLAVYTWLLTHSEGGTLAQISKATNYIPTGVSARLRELRRLYNLDIKRKPIKTKSLSRVFVYSL